MRRASLNPLRNNPNWYLNLLSCALSVFDFFMPSDISTLYKLNASSLTLRRCLLPRKVKKHSFLKSNPLSGSYSTVAPCLMPSIGGSRRQDILGFTPALLRLLKSEPEPRDENGHWLANRFLLGASLWSANKDFQRVGLSDYCTT